MDYSNILIEWDNLRLRCIKMDDAEDIFREFTKEIITYMYPDISETIDGIYDFIDTSIATTKEGYNMQFVLEIADTNEFLGCVGCHKVHTKTPEFGIWIKKSAHGNGYGKKAIQKLYEYCSDVLDVDYFLYPVDERNIPSRNIPESLGGIVAKKENEVGMSGNELRLLYYHILPKKNSKRGLNEI